MKMKKILLIGLLGSVLTSLSAQADSFKLSMAFNQTVEMTRPAGQPIYVKDKAIIDMTVYVRAEQQGVSKKQRQDLDAMAQDTTQDFAIIPSKNHFGAPYAQVFELQDGKEVSGNMNILPNRLTTIVLDKGLRSEREEMTKFTVSGKDFEKLYSNDATQMVEMFYGKIAQSGMGVDIKALRLEVEDRGSVFGKFEIEAIEDQQKVKLVLSSQLGNMKCSTNEKNINKLTCKQSFVFMLTAKAN